MRSGLDVFTFDPHVPQATVLLRLAAARVESGAVGEEAEPVYLRPPDAEINWVTR
jgi:tRNA A37 threonylcarbamoyladenosine modification protein TsaB